MRGVLIEQRKKPRRRPAVPQGIRISTGRERGAGRIVAAKLIDGSEAGVGVETFVPLPVGSVVVVEGNLKEAGYALVLKGQARVTHAREMGNGTFRIGLWFDEVSYRRPS
jgi:hypothetical protein